MVFFCCDGVQMIRFRLSELIADKQFREGRRITLIEVANATGINRMTLSRMLNQKGYNTVTDNLDRLCTYFGCELGELAVYLPGERLEESGEGPEKREEDGQSRSLGT
jgi:DNA-binding Xre family transcriptional regulator